MPQMPGGTVTFLFTDIEDSTRLWEQQPEQMRPSVARHDALLQACIDQNDGVVVKQTGDGFHAVFAQAEDALTCALSAQRSLLAELWDPAPGRFLVRMGLHTGTAELRDGDYYGTAVNRAARLGTAANGGQILLSETTRALVQDALPEGVSLVDLGEHRLRGLDRPEHVYQLLAADLPPVNRALRTAQDSRRNNLPGQATPFFGRGEELLALEQLLADPDVRLVTIVGPGGMGKTRLSLATAQRELAGSRFTDGVYFVPLAPVSEPDQIAPAIGSALGLRFYGSGTPEEQLAHQLRSKRLLLVLDNFEQLVSGAELLSGLLADAPGIAMLATSRQRLNLVEEWAFDLQGLPYPAADGALDQIGAAAEALIDRYSCLQLFVQRARQADARFSPAPENLDGIIRICRLVGGMPLGIELAAAWTTFMSPAEIAVEISTNLDFLTSAMSNLPDRHRSLRAVFRYSWALLSEEEQRTFARLSAFRGGFTREAAVAIGATMPVLVQLLAKSLLHRAQDGRFEVHELLRQYAAEKLDEQPVAAEEARARHAAFFAKFMADCEPELTSPRMVDALDAIAADFDNVTLAWRWAAERVDTKLLIQTTTSLARFCEIRGRYAEGTRLLRRSIDRLQASLPPEPPSAHLQALGVALVEEGALRTRLGGWAPTIEQMERASEFLQAAGPKAIKGLFETYYMLALNYYFTGQTEVGWVKAQQSLELATAAGDDMLMGRAYSVMGHLAEFQGDYRQAVRTFSESLEHLEKLGEQRQYGYSKNNWGRAAYAMGDYDQAERLIRSALASRRNADDHVAIAYSLLDLGMVATMRGDFAAAQESILEALDITERHGLLDSSARNYSGLGMLERVRGQVDQAKEHYRHSLDIYGQIKVKRGRPIALNGLAAIAIDQGRPDEARAYLMESLSLAEELGNRADEATALGLYGRLAMAEGKLEEAANYLQQALAIADKSGARPLALEIFVDAAQLFLSRPARHEAFELLALVAAHPAAAYESRMRAQTLLAELPDGFQPVAEGAAGEPADVWRAAAGLRDRLATAAQ